MHGSGTSHEPLDGCESIVRDYLAQGQCTLAMGVLIQHYQDAIVSYCRCHLLDQELAREVTQELFLTACAGLRGFRGRSSLKTWLYGIALKKCLEVGRTRQRREALVRTHQDTIGALVHCDPPSLPEDLVSQEVCRRRVWHALRRLRVYDRELLVLRYLEDLTYDEIASILHVSRRTVERHLPRAEAKFCHAYERCHTHAVSPRRPPWTPQHTRALFRLFQTSAPPDFQRQILERVAQRQAAHGRRRLGWCSLLAWWRGDRAWSVGTLQRHRRWPGHVIAMVGCCGLVLGTSLAWWAARMGPAVPPAPTLLMSRAVSLPRTPDVPTETPLRGDHRGGVGRTEPPEAAGPTAGPPEASTSAPQMQMGQSVGKSTALQAEDDPERALFVPAPVQQLTVQKERQPPVHRTTQRSVRPRGAPGKPSRPHTRPGTSQQAPG